MNQKLEKKSFLYVWNGFALFYSHSHSNSSHTHYAASIIHSFDKPFELEFSNGEKQKLQSVFLPSNYEHRLNADSAILVIQVDPDSPEYAPLHSFSLNEPVDLQEKIPRELEKEMNFISDCKKAKEFIKNTLNLVGGIDSPVRSIKSSLDYRIKQTIKYLQSLEELPPKISLKTLASQASLSSDRFRHLFVQEMGLSIRRYLLWLRVRKAGSLLQKGFNLTDAAHDAGFTDSAHFSKTFKQNFGIIPSLILSNRDVKIHYCDLQEYL